MPTIWEKIPENLRGDFLTHTVEEVNMEWMMTIEGAVNVKVMMSMQETVNMYTVGVVNINRVFTLA